MAYSSLGLAKVGSNFAGATLHRYVSTADSLATIKASGYFTDEVFSVNDIIFVVGSDGRDMMYVTTASPVATADYIDATSPVIPDGSITAAKLATGAVTAPALGAGSVTSAALGAGAVTSAAIGSGAVLAAALGAGSVTAPALGAGSVTAPAMGISAVETSAIADGAVNGSKMAANAIATATLQDASVTKAKLAPDSIDGSKIEDDALNSEHYAAGSIDTEHYAAGSVDSAALGTGSVTSTKIAAGAVDSTALGAGAVTSTKLGANAVGTSALADDVVSGAKIATYATSSQDPGALLIYHFSTPGGPSANTDVILNENITLVAAYVHLNGAGTAADTVQLKTAGGANNVTSAVNISSSASGDNISTNLIPPHDVFNQGQQLRIAQVDGGGNDSPPLRITLIGFKHP